MRGRYAARRTLPGSKRSPLYTEQDIRLLALRFLRSHYKDRPRAEASKTRTEARAHFYQGCKIDATLAFQRPDLTWFTATLEATSRATRAEITYRINWVRLLSWSLIAGLITLIGIFAGTQVQGGGEPVPPPLLLTLTACAMALALLLGLGRQSARYLYAVEQFKRFHADDQWIAYDREIFADLPERFRAELIRQCIRYGFGLIEVLPNERIREVLEPSRIDQFEGARTRLPAWIAAVDVRPRLRNIVRNVNLPAFPGRRRPTPVSPHLLSGPLPPHRKGEPVFLDREGTVYAVFPALPGRPKWYAQPGKTWAHLRWGLRNSYRSALPAAIRRRPGYYSLPTWYLPVVGSLALLCWWLATREAGL